MRSRSRWKARRNGCSASGCWRPRLCALRLPPDSDGDGEGGGEVEVAWEARRGVPAMSTPVLADGRLYMVDDSGRASCLDARTGATLWSERLGASCAASPLFAAGRVYFFDQEGGATVVAASATFERLAENELDAGFMASPAVAGDTLVLRTEEAVYRIGRR